MALKRRNSPRTQGCGAEGGRLKRLQSNATRASEPGIQREPAFAQGASVRRRCCLLLQGPHGHQRRHPAARLYSLLPPLASHDPARSCATPATPAMADLRSQARPMSNLQCRIRGGKRKTTTTLWPPAPNPAFADETSLARPTPSSNSPCPRFPDASGTPHAHLPLSPCFSPAFLCSALHLHTQWLYCNTLGALQLAANSLRLASPSPAFHGFFWSAAGSPTSSAPTPNSTCRYDSSLGKNLGPANLLQPLM